MKSPTRYKEALRAIYGLNFQGSPVKMSLDTSLFLYNKLGRPLENTGCEVVHVGGTNGKGSVCFKLAKAFEAAGLKTGLFVSPHLSSFTERVQVDSKPMTEQEVADTAFRLIKMCKDNGMRPSMFDIVTAISFLKFSESKCDVAVYEVGLGGALDSTNIFANPALSIITSIQFDHTKILGNTLVDIARVKSGIMKAGRPVLIGPHCPIGEMHEQAIQRGSKLYTLEDLSSTPHRSNQVEVNTPIDASRNSNNNDICKNIYNNYNNSQPGSYEVAEQVNIVLAQAALKILTNPAIVGSKAGTLFSKCLRSNSQNSSSSSSSSNVSGRADIENDKSRYIDDRVFEATLKRPSCRFEIINRKRDFLKESVAKVMMTDSSSNEGSSNESSSYSSNDIQFILDIGHNPAAIKDFVSKVKIYTEDPDAWDIRVVVGMSADKVLGDCVSMLLDLVTHADDITCVQALHPRAMSGIDLSALVRTQAMLLRKPYRNELNFGNSDLDKGVTNSTSSITSSHMDSSNSCYNDNDNNSSKLSVSSKYSPESGFRRAVSSLLSLSNGDALDIGSESLSSSSSSSPQPSSSSVVVKASNVRRKALVLVTGSFFIMPDIRRLLGFDELVDDSILLETSLQQQQSSRRI